MSYYAYVVVLTVFPFIPLLAVVICQGVGQVSDLFSRRREPRPAAAAGSRVG
jgi:hypothetical protein